MHLSRTSALLLSLALGSLAAPTPSGVLHEKRDASTVWLKGSRVHGDVKLPMRIGLTQSNLDKGHDLLNEVSHPGSARYGKHYTAEEVADIFAPSKDTVKSVKAWLEAAGIRGVSQSINKQWLQFDAKTSEAEDLFGSEYHFFEHKGLGSTSIACDEYAVLRSYVAFDWTDDSAKVPRPSTYTAPYRLYHSWHQTLRQPCS